MKNIKPAYKLFMIIMIFLILIFIIFNNLHFNDDDFKIDTSQYLSGDEYYQQTIKANDYQMNLQFNNETHTLSGTVKINLTNDTNNEISTLCLRNYACAITGQKSVQAIYVNQVPLQFDEYGAKSALEIANIDMNKKTKDIASIIEVK